MAEELNTFINILNICLSGNDVPNKTREAKNNVENIIKYFADDLSRSNIDAAFTGLFDKKSGILKFISSASKLDGFSDAIRESFLLLRKLVCDFKDRISPYVLEIRDLCKNCIVLGKMADEKEKACEVMLAVVENEPWNIVLQWSDIFRILYEPFTTNKANTLPGKVLQKHMHILGVLARRHPDCVGKNERTVLMKIFVSHLEKQVKHASAVKYQVIVGCLIGLTEYLYSSPLKPDDPNCKKIYDCVKCISQKHKELRVAPKEALLLIVAHADQFAHLLCADYESWHKFLLKWVNSSGPDHKVGVRTLDMFYKQIVLHLKKDEVGSGKAVFKYFITYFKNTMLRGDATQNEMKLVIKAFGAFAGPCHTYMKQDDVLFMFNVVLQQAQQIYSSLREEELSDLPHYVESLSSIMVELDIVSKEQLTSLVYLTVILIENFPKLPSAFHIIATHAISAAFCNLVQIGSTVFSHFVTSVVYQGLIRSCSHQLVVDAELQRDELQDKPITYKDYVPLWKSLLRRNSLTDKCKSEEQASLIIIRIYDELIEATQTLTAKLDLSTRPKADTTRGSVDVPIVDPESGLEANTRKDFQIFINLVDLIRDVLPGADPKLFDKWTQPFIYHLMTESSRKPLVSGFYKLLTVALQLCDTNCYFTGIEGVENQSVERRTFYTLVCSFLRELLLKLLQYKNDLEMACLETILAAPVALVVPLIPHAAPAFQAVFRVGRSMLHLASVGLSALDKWTTMLPPHVMKPLLVQVLPHLDPFLRSKGIGGTEDVVVDLQLKLLSRKKRAGAIGSSKRVLKKRTMERPDSELAQLQNQIISFLGQLDCGTCLALLSDPYSQDMWGPCLQQPLHFALPFNDMKLKVRLEKLIPEVVDLALSSSDRVTRFTACELLHAVVIFILGTGKELQNSQPNMYTEILKKLSLPLLKLGCDPDQAVCSLYRLLVLQLTHWYSSRFMLRSKHTEIFIDTLMEGITHPTDTALRDLSAKCLGEFVSWSIKQMSDAELMHSPTNIKAIMKQVYSFCVHPSPAKRLGAGLVVNSMYTVLREQEQIVNQFWLELLYYMVVNLSHAGSIQGGQQQIVAALGHIERVLREKAVLFNKDDSKRRKPPEFEGVTLKHAVCWLLLKCGTLQAECRHECIKMVDTLTPLLQDCKSTVEFVNWYVETYSVLSLVKICEGNEGITTPDSSSLVHVTLWLNKLLTSLECYVWLFGRKLVQPSELFETGHPRIVEAIVLFVEKLSFCSAGAAVTGPAYFTPWEIETYNTSKCSVIVRILDVMSQVLQNNNKSCITTLLHNTTLWGMIAVCVFHPGQLGFDLRSFTINTGLRSNLIEFLEVLQKSLSLGEMSVLYSELGKIMNVMKGDVFDNLQEMLRNDSVTVEQKEFVQGLEILQTSGMLSKVVDDDRIDGTKIIKDLFCSVVEEHGNSKLAVILKPASQELAELFYKFAFLLNPDVGIVISCLKDSTVIKNPVTKFSLLHGEHFFATLQCVILDSILQRSKTFAACLLQDAIAENMYWILSILAELVQQLAKIQNREKTTCSLMEVIVNNFSQLSRFCESSPERIYELLGVLINLAKVKGNAVGVFQNHEMVCNWVIMQLTSQHLQLNHKTRALSLLVCLTTPQEDTNIALERALQTFRHQHMPCVSVASVEYAAFIPAFKKILQILEDSGSCVILRSVVSMAASETEHVFEDEIRQSLHKFIRRLDFNNQRKAIDVVCTLFLDELYDPDTRLNCALRFIQPLLQGCKAVVAREFYRNFIKTLQRLISVVVDKRGGITVEHQLVGKIGAWSLLELMFIHLEQSELESKECVITAAAFPGGIQTGKELISDLSNKAYNYRKENLSDTVTGNARVVELFRKSQCAAFNALVAIISNTKTDVKFYTGLIFNVNSTTKEYVWKCLVDCNRSYSLTLDWAEIPKRRKHLVSIRSEARSNRRETYGNVSQTVKYIPTVSQYLFDSTLNEDVTMFDLSTSVVCAEAMEDDLESESTAINLEVDDLNQHECMATLCGMIQHMVDRGISPPPERGAKADKLPLWMVQLHKCLDDSKQPCNVRLFLIKVLLNTEDKFRPYAHLWLNTILKVIDDGVVGSSPNYLLSDVVAMLVEWKSGLSYDDGINIELLNQLVELLIRNVEHSRRDVFKHNLELIRTVVELWKTNVQVPFQLVHDMMMRKDDKDPRVSEPGIQVCAILLANGLTPWSSANKQEFMLAALRHMDGEKRDIYQSSSEVVGLALKFEEDSTNLLASVIGKLNLLKEKSKAKFITCLFGIQEHYPCIVRPFVRQVLFELPKLYGSFRAMCLKIVYSRLELQGEEDVDGDVADDEIYVELKVKGLFKILNDRDPDQQVLALNIINKIVHRLNTEQVIEVVEVVHKLDTHQNKHCRSVMYDILRWVHDYCQEMGGDVITQAKSTLLRGLRDDDPLLQDTIFKYWFNSSRMQDASTSSQLLYIMSDLYSPSAENIFLGYLSQLLLEATADTPDYKQNIFKAPLSKCEFEDFKMILSWRAQHTTAVPMFADTLASQISQSQFLGSATPIIRATQNTLAFQPTLVQEDASLNVSSSLLYSIANPGSSQNKSYKMGPGFGSKKLTQSDEVDAPTVEVRNLRRRFTRGNENVKRNFYAGLEIKRNERRKQLEAERGRRREANIASFRNYRSGDFPDIEIPHSAIIKPLQELAKRVPTVARQIFVLLLDSLLSELFDDERDLFSKRAEDAMNSILYQSKEYAAVLMAAIMQVALHNSKYFSLNPEYVAAASQVSGLLALGSLVLEETLIHRDDDNEAGPSKRCKPNHDELWVLLAELYISMDEWDVVHGIFHSHLDCGDNVKEAIKWEASGNWSKARKMYAKSLAEMDSDDVLSDYCYEAFYKCLANLSDWNELNKQIQQQVDSDLDKLWEEWYQDKLLPQFVLSEIQLMLDKGLEGSSRQAFISKVTEWLSDKEKSSHLSNYMSEELAMIFVLQDNSARANQHVQHTLNAFLNSWTDLNPLSHKLRTRQLLDLQKTAEIQAYLTFSTNCDSSKNKMKAKDLAKRWSNTLPLSTDPLLLWDARSMYRKKFVQKIDDDGAERSVTSTQLAMVDSALCQNNFSVARKYLEQTIRQRDINGDKFKLEWNLRFVKAKWLEMQLKEDVNKQFEMKLNCWDLLDSRLEKNMVAKFPELYVKTLQHISTITTGILHHLDDHPSVLTDVSQQVIDKLVQRVGASDSSKSTLTDCLKKFGLRSLKETVDEENRNKNPDSIAQAYLQVAKYCRAYCKDSLNEGEFGSEITISVLRAMKYGSWEARQLFPCILQLPHLNTHPLSQQFSRESLDIPVWMLLGWVNQLLARLNTPVGPVLYDMVRLIAHMYPQAIIYGFQVSQENYELGSTQPGLKAFVQELANKLFLNSVMETFLRAFSCLGQPCIMLQYFVKKLVEESHTNHKSLAFIYDTMMKELFTPCADTKIHGKIFEDIAKFNSILQKAETKIKQGNKNVMKDLNQVLHELQQKIEKIKTPVQVKDYSPWLSEFQASRYSGMELEMPGQYTGESKPLVQHHVKIVGFKQTVEIMKSKAMPMVLTMLGSDGKEHKYLVKFGEDLRQDQRLEQMFNIMNKILKQNAICKQRKLELSTYQVIPFSSHIGIVEWVSGTQVLGDLMTSAFEGSEKKEYVTARARYNRWISSSMRGKKVSSFLEVYGEAQLKFTRDESIAAFREKVNMVPWDLLRRAILKLSVSPESYFALRHNFACSYAVMCIAHWLLGIGDRHLKNTLVTLKNGRCVGIDFGMSFGAGTQFLPVPELMPFRLTPHIVNLMQPLEETGLMRETMIHCLRTLCGSTDLLLATLEVFVQEPSMDWLDFARKHESLNKDSKKESQEWYPQQKLDLANLKLEGANPAFITTKELEAGFKNLKYLPKYLEAAKGIPNENVRARLPMKNLTTEQQVDCLLDQAMDYNILSRTWVGWESWM